MKNVPLVFLIMVDFGGLRMLLSRKSWGVEVDVCGNEKTEFVFSDVPTVSWSCDRTI